MKVIPELRFCFKVTEMFLKSHQIKVVLGKHLEGRNTEECRPGRRREEDGVQGGGEGGGGRRKEKYEKEERRAGRGGVPDTRVPKPDFGNQAGGLVSSSCYTAQSPERASSSLRLHRTQAAKGPHLCC